MSYPDLPNPDLLSRIPVDARVVLDVGCSAGALGAEHKRRNPAARVLGIEGNPAAAETARRRLDQVYVADLDYDPTPFAADVGKGGLDCIIYGDVLEHLRNPWELLRRHAEYLAPEGSVLICMPNLDHWSFAERLLRGTWGYEDQGLFDVTHLRWFTADAVRRALHRAGLVPIDMSPRIFDVPSCEQFVDALAPGLRRLGIDPAAYRERAAPLQHVWRARRTAAPDRLTLVSTMLHPIGGVSDVRVTEPMQALIAEPSLSTSVIATTEDPPPELDIEGPRIFILHRPLLVGSTGLARLKVLLRRGWLLVCEFDDHPDYIPVLQRPDIQNFRAVHAIQTTTEPLAAVLREHNPEVAVFENAIARLPDAVNFAADDHMTLLFAGLNREGEWPPYIDALNAVAQRAGPRLRFQVISDRAMFDALQTRHKSFTPICDYATYRDLLARSEISFMPLSDTSFNQCKSDLKFIEGAAYRVVALAGTVVYSSTIEDGRTGALFNSPAELEQRLGYLLANPGQARAIGDAARGYVRDRRMLAYQLRRRVAWYHALWARREALTRSLLARVPELRD